MRGVLTGFLRRSRHRIILVRYAQRMRAILLAVAIVLVGVLVAGAAPAGLPAPLAGYQAWTKMNGRPLDDPSNPRAGPKNTFSNLSPPVLRDLAADGGRLRAPFPEGAIIARETLDVAAGFVRVLFVMEKDRTALRTKGWRFSSFSRQTADAAFQQGEIQDPVARCLNCHLQMGATDFVFTPFLSRPDLPAVRTPTAPGRVEMFNYRFGPQTVRVRVGATVVFVNYDAVVHDVKAADRSFESGNVPVLGRFFQTFDRPGTVDYFCGVHLEMRGRIIVEP